MRSASGSGNVKHQKADKRRSRQADMNTYGRGFFLAVGLSVGQLVGLCAFAQSEILCTEVLRLYPLEFFDQTRWWELCNQGASVEELIGELDDPLVRDA